MAESHPKGMKDGNKSWSGALPLIERSKPLSPIERAKLLNRANRLYVMGEYALAAPLFLRLYGTVSS